MRSNGFLGGLALAVLLLAAAGSGAAQSRPVPPASEAPGAASPLALADRPDGSDRRASPQCFVWATAQNDTCYNVDGTVSFILTPGTLSAAGCGADEGQARSAATQSLSTQTCLTTYEERAPGCCTVRFATQE